MSTVSSGDPRRRRTAADRPRLARTVLIVLAAGLLVAAASCTSDDDDGGAEATGDTDAGAGAAATTTTAEPAPEWPAPDDPLARAVSAGLEPERREELRYHRHAHLDVFVNGQHVTVPAGIGINIADPGVRTFGGPSYGGIELCDDPCISPLHTHDDTGILHTESADRTFSTLGQFFTEWGVRLDDNCVDEYCEPVDIAAYLDGEPYDGNLSEIELKDHLEIALVVGSPPETIPDTADFSAA